MQRWKNNYTMNVLDIFFSPHMRTRFSNVFQVYHKSEIKWEKPRARNQMNTKNSRMYERAYGKKKVPAENKKNEKKKLEENNFIRLRQNHFITLTVFLCFSFFLNCIFNPVASFFSVEHLLAQRSAQRPDDTTFIWR